MVFSKIRCGLHLRPSSHRSIFQDTPLMDLSHHHIFNNLRINNLPSFAIQEATPRCNQLCNTQVCKAWVKAIPLQGVVFTKPIKARNNLCSPILPDLSQVLRAGLGNNHQDLQALGGQGSLNDDLREDLSMIMSYDRDWMMMSTYT
jgi:hypothetical protein